MTTPQTTPELLPCPFCNHSIMRMRPIGQMQQAHCDGCGAAGPLFSNERPAIDAWNTRARVTAAPLEGVSWPPMHLADGVTTNPEWLTFKHGTLNPALEATSSAQPLAPPPGWKLVPLEPTVEMIGVVAFGEAANLSPKNACCQSFVPDDVVEKIYRAMVAAAPPTVVNGEARWKMLTTDEIDEVFERPREHNAFVYQAKDLIDAFIAKNSLPPGRGMVPMGEEKKQPLTVRVCVFEHCEPFVFWVNGMVTAQVLASIDADLLVNRDDILQDGEGDYEFEVTRFDGQYGFEGACELAPGWEFNQIGFISLSELNARAAGSGALGDGGSGT